VIRFHLTRQSFSELVKPYNGLTSVSEEVLFRTDSHYSQRIYELICQWKDKEVFTMSIERFREFMGLGQKYHTSNALINGVIKPAERDLDAIADVFFRFSSSKAGTRITHLNFAIKHRKSVKQVCEMNLRIRDQVVNILRIRFGFREEHFKVIARLLADDSMLRLLNQKVGELWTILDQRSYDIRNVPAWALAAIMDKFDPKRENEAALQIGYETN
jgi:plasmid replication initiation protein